MVLRSFRGSGFSRDGSRQKPGSRLKPLLQALALAGVCAGAGATEPRAKKPDRADQVPPTAGAYLVREASPENLRLAEPKLPDLAPYTAIAVAKKIKRAPAGRVYVARMVEHFALSEFTGGEEREGMAEWARRQNTNPQAIVVSGGTVWARDIAKTLPHALGESGKGIYTLRLPLLVDKGATLVIDGSVRELRLSQDRGAFLVNDGEMYIMDTRLLGWREHENRPATFRDPKEFRPFITSWGGTALYIVNSTVAHLGYDASKAYGIAITQYSPGRQKIAKRGPATGWILDSEFVDNWFGFYCYEADDVVVARNRYRDNIIYGVDPHDRSNRLIVAQNEVSGATKHGIIFSREVNHGWIYGNRVYGNKLSGIMLDRASSHNVIADNIVFNNGSDGITVYESSDNLIWKNASLGNAHHGIRVRNSVRVALQHNRAVANGQAGIRGDVKDLTGTDRNLKLDPFEKAVSLVVVGGELIYNGSGPVSIDQPLSLELYDVDLLAPTTTGGFRLHGVLGEHQTRVLDLLVRKRVPVVIEPVDKQERES